MNLFGMIRSVERVTQAPAWPAQSSPWAGTSAEKIVRADIQGIRSSSVTREDAMKVPAIVKARALLCGQIAKLPLRAYRGAERIEEKAWMYRSDSAFSPHSRMVWTVDDLIFYGTSLWALKRGPSGEVTDALRVARDRWQIEDDLGIKVDGEFIADDEVCLIEGPQEGLLSIADTTIDAALDMANAWANRVNSPVPLVELHNTDRAMAMTDDEIDDLIDSWEESRRNGGTAYTPNSIETKIHGQAATDLFIEGRNASRLDFANFTNVPGALLEGSQAQSTLTYSTQEGKRNEFADFTVDYWIGPIAARLSMDDITPSGERVEFDTEILKDPQPTEQATATKD